jgi:large subunit ribosomal protein L25
VAETYTLDAQARTITGKKVNQLRVQGLVPAIIYGRNRQPVAVQIPAKPLQMTLLRAGGTHLININVDGQQHTVITREVQRDILRGNITHVDFMTVDASTRLTAEVRIHFVNESLPVTSRQGILVTGTSTVTIEALPSDLIEQIEVDLSTLKEVGDSIHVRDLKVNPAIRIVNDEDEMIVRVAPAVTAEEEETTEETTSAEPEVISKGKAEEEDF